MKEEADTDIPLFVIIINNTKEGKGYEIPR